MPFYSPGVYNITSDERRRGDVKDVKARPCYYLGHSQDSPTSVVIRDAKNGSIKIRKSVRFEGVDNVRLLQELRNNMINLENDEEGVEETEENMVAQENENKTESEEDLEEKDEDSRNETIAMRIIKRRNLFLQNSLLTVTMKKILFTNS